MSHCVYGVWDGAVIDARRDSASRRAPPLAGLDDIAPDTGAMAFIADRGFVVLDDSVCLAHAFAGARGGVCGKIDQGGRGGHERYP